MRMLPVLSLLLLSSCFGSSVNGELPGAPPLTAVGSLDLDRYLGLWYEIAKYPVSFEEGLVGVTAEYSMREDGEIRVLNSGLEGGFDGELDTAEGTAWIPDPAEPAKLRVRFFWPFTGDYWVIALDPEYRWAVVGEPGRSYLWILSRTPSLPEDEYVSILGRITELGFDTRQLERMPQATP